MSHEASPAPRAALSGWRGVVARLLMVGLSVGFTLAVFEIGARFLVDSWAPQHGVRNFWMQDPQLGWRHNPGQDAIHHHRDFDVRVVTNELGFRDDPVRETLPRGMKRVVFLGDSFGFGYGVEQEEGIADLLDESFPDADLVNTAVAGYGTDQQLLFMREQGFGYEPDLVLLLLHPNDVEDNNADRRYRYAKPHFELREDGELELTGVPIPPMSLRQKFGRFLQQRTYVLYRVWDWRKQVRQIAASLSAPDEPDAAAPKPVAPEVAAEASPPDVAAKAPAPGGIEDAAPGRIEDAPPGRIKRRPTVAPKPGRNQDFTITQALIRQLTAEVRAAGAQLAIVSIPGAPDPRELLTELLVELDVPYLALDPVFDGMRRTEYKFQHDPHWTAVGHRLAAEATATWLRDQGLL